MSTLSPAVYKRIEEWVSNTDGESSRARASTSNPPIVMSAPRPLRYIHTREQPIEQPDPYLTVEGKKEHLEYERRPRRKTKEDRYEYKVKKAHGRLKNPIKDNFHASNVPCDRLTLNPNQPLGIFSKGKASAPVKACHGYNYVHPDPRFSEKRFLLGWEAPSPSVNDSTSESNERVYGYGYPNFRAPEHPDVACNAPSQGEDYPRRQATAPEVATNNVQTLELAPGRGSERLHAELSNLQSSAPDTNQDRLQAASLDKDDSKQRCRVSKKRKRSFSPDWLEAYAEGCSSKAQKVYSEPDDEEEMAFSEQEYTPTDQPRLLGSNTDWQSDSVPEKDIDLPNLVERVDYNVEASRDGCEELVSECHAPLSQFHARGNSLTLSLAPELDDHLETRMSASSLTLSTGNSDHEEVPYCLPGVEQMLSGVHIAPSAVSSDFDVSDTQSSSRAAAHYTDKHHIEETSQEIIMRADALDINGAPCEWSSVSNHQISSAAGFPRRNLNRPWTPGSSIHYGVASATSWMRHSHGISQGPAPAYFDRTLSWLETRVRGHEWDKVDTVDLDMDVAAGLGEFWQRTMLH